MAAITMIPRQHWQAATSLHTHPTPATMMICLSHHRYRRAANTPEKLPAPIRNTTNHPDRNNPNTNRNGHPQLMSTKICLAAHHHCSRNTHANSAVVHRPEIRGHHRRNMVPAAAIRGHAQSQTCCQFEVSFDYLRDDKRIGMFCVILETKKNVILHFILAVASTTPIPSSQLSDDQQRLFDEIPGSAVEMHAQDQVS